MPPRKRNRHTGPMNQPSDSPDLISALPDEVLASVLSLLPLKDSARTSILSSRWRNLCKAAILRLDDSSLQPESSLAYLGRGFLDPWDWSRAALSSIFDSHHGPVETLSLSRFSQDKFFPTVDRFVESAVQRGIRELTLNFSWPNVYYNLLPSLLQCQSLQLLSLRFCQFPDPIPHSIFPSLKELRLHFIEVSSDLFQSFLSSCQFLETLDLFFTFNGLTVVSVSSARLRRLVWHCPDTRELIIEHAPHLESLILHADSTIPGNVKVRYAPKLQLFGILYLNFEVLQLGETYFVQKRQEPFDTNEPTLIIDVKATPYGLKTLYSVKTLAIKMKSFYNLEGIMPSLLRCFPCLENLDVLNYNLGNSAFRFGRGFWDKEDYFSFVDHLKTVTVMSFSGSQSEVEFLKFLVVHGKALKKITLFCSNCINKKLVSCPCVATGSVKKKFIIRCIGKGDTELQTMYSEWCRRCPHLERQLTRHLSPLL